MDGVLVWIYGADKMLPDCFKYRNKIITDTAFRALKLYRQRKRIKVQDLLDRVRICRVDKVVPPYLKSVL
jgi:hypothetical protein